jgi:hypothetical protein
MVETLLRPCREFRVEERQSYICRRNNDVVKGVASKIIDGKNTAVIQYLNFPDIDRGMYEFVEDSSLIPLFGHSSTDGLYIMPPSMMSISSGTCNK